MSSSIEKDQDPDTFIGLAFPLGFANDGIFRKTKTTLEQARYNLRNLLLTVKGERLAHPEFGCDNRLNVDIHFSLKNDLTGYEEVLDVFYDLTE